MNNPIENIEKLIQEKGMEFRDFKLMARKKEETAAEEELILEGTPCVYNQETVLWESASYEAKEVIAPGALDEADMSDVIFNFNHCGRVYARTRNKSLELSNEGDGLHMRARLLPEDEGHKQLYRDIQSGLIDRMSFAFTVKESDYDYSEIEGKTIVQRTITKIDKLYDVSAVDFPAYDTTEISARSHFDSERERRLEEIKKRESELELAKAKFNYL